MSEMHDWAGTMRVEAGGYADDPYVLCLISCTRPGPAEEGTHFFLNHTRVRWLIEQLEGFERAKWLSKGQTFQDGPPTEDTKK